MMRKKLVLVAVGLLAAYLLGRAVLPRSVRVVSPARGPAVEAVYATGTVEPTIMLPIAPRVGANLQRLLVDEGDNVTAGQPLAELEDAEEHANLEQLKTEEALAKTEFERASRLLARQAISQDEFDKARSRVRSTEAARKAAEARWQYLTLVSPAAGKVIRRDGEVGQMVAANQPVYWLSGSNELRISAEVDEEDIPRVREGQEVLIRADAFPGQMFKGVVKQITPKGDPIARSYRVRVHFTEPSAFQIGMTAETNIILRKAEDALLVPTGAVLGDKLWVVKDGRLSARKVSVGARGTDQTEIREGLTDKDEVCVNPQESFAEGMRVFAHS